MFASGAELEARAAEGAAFAWFCFILGHGDHDT